jgi:acyl-CoA thioester hydrolase
MGRIKLDLPAIILDRVSIAVRITDINYGNHLGNDSMVGIIHEARVLWLKKMQSTELDIAGTSLIMSDLAVEYIGESFYGDTLNISIHAGEVSRVGFELFYSVHTSREGNDYLIAKAKTGMICFDYQARKVVSVPEKLRNILSGI